ncbi:MAG TPA: glycosyltransferase family 2 protein [Stellaceae bacterium]|nr:glycosyltransferase family 2 protein [Stellaceae bacterium]HEV2302259.1 glycosyltransferase family 2 protein [Stellaceae bacterium]
MAATVQKIDTGAPYPPRAATAGLAVSVVVPIFDEQDNIPLLCAQLVEVLRATGVSFEIIAVNDGSHDASLRQLVVEAAQFPDLRVIDLRRNYGQTAAIMAGIDHSIGEVIITIDADLQNDPEDIPLLLAKLDEGYDVVSGWRKDRRDAPIRRNLLSRVANRLISRISGVRLNDYGCTLKAYRRDVLAGMRLYGEMHRFIPIYASWMGARIAQVPVRHHPRRFGKSKYGLDRLIKVILDLTVVRFLDKYFAKPIYVFGGFGMFSLLMSVAAAVYMFYLKFFENLSMIQTPLPLVVTLTFLVGVISILMGLLAEILVRIYFESQGRAAYSVRDFINFDHRE